jgi:hypothetical protein
LTASSDQCAYNVAFAVSTVELDNAPDAGIIGVVSSASGLAKYPKNEWFASKVGFVTDVILVVAALSEYQPIEYFSYTVPDPPVPPLSFSVTVKVDGTQAPGSVASKAAGATNSYPGSQVHDFI